MAGYMYLGSHKVCPAILVGGSPAPEQTNFYTLKIPDSIKKLDSSVEIYTSMLNKDTNEYLPFKLDFNNVEEISGSAWGYVTNNLRIQRKKIAIDFGKVKKIGSGSDFAFAQAFFGAEFYEGNTDIEFKELEEVANYCFGSCFSESNVTSIKFYKLKRIGNSAFQDLISRCSDVDIYFYAVTSDSFNTNAFRYICEYATNTTLHFPSNTSDIVSTLTGYPNFGGTNTTIVYDLPATE